VADTTDAPDERLLANVLRDSADAIIFLDNERRIRTWNRGAEAMYGYRTEEILGQSIEKLVPRELLQDGELQRIDELIDRDGLLWHYKTERLAKDGRRIFVDLSCSSVRDEEGELLGRSVIHRDITEQRRLERELIQSEKLSAIGKLSAHVVHEIRNPLASIRLNLELLQDELNSGVEADFDEAKTLLRAVQAEVEVLSSFTTEVLQFTRPGVLNRTEVDLHELLAEAVGQLREDMHRGAVLVSAKFEPDAPAVLADPVKLRQVISHLARNAFDAMNGQGRLDLKLRRNKDFMEIEMHDSGPGIAEELLPKIFDPFFTTKAGGTGLGLAISRQILREHGGGLEVRNASPGAAFTLRLPL